MLDSEILKQDTKSERVKELILDIKEEKFDPRSYLTSQFRFNYLSDENEMIESLKSQLELAETDLRMVENDIDIEFNELKNKEELEQTNNYYQLQNIDVEYKDLMTEVQQLSQSIGLEYEQLKIVGEELSELNNLRDEKLMLSEIMEVFGMYNKKDNDGKIEENFLQKNFNEGNANSLIVKLDCLKSALETLNYEEFIEVKKKINQDFGKAKKETLKQFKSYLKISEYKEARKMFEFIEKIGEIDGAEKVYEEIIIGEKGNDYGITEKDQNMREFLKYLFSLGIALQQYHQGDSVFIEVHGTRANEILTKVCSRIMRDRICKLTSRLLAECMKESKPEFFLYYLDEMNMKFEEFKKKNNSMEKLWSILDSLSEAYKEVVEKYQTQYYEIERSEFNNYLEQKTFLKIEDVKKSEERAKAITEQDPFTEKLKEIDRQLSNEAIEEFVNRAKACIERCYRNSLTHMKADNCGDMLILFMNKLTEYLIQLIELAESAIPDPLDKNPARIQLFSIVSKILTLTKRVDLFFLEFKTKITNMFKLDEAEKVKLQSLKVLTENISGTLNFAMRNLFAEVSQIWKIFKKKKKKKIKDFESGSPLAKALTQLLGTYLDFIFNNFNIEQKVNLMKVIGIEFIKFLERQIPLEKYSQNELIKLNIDIEEYDDQLFDFIDEEEVTQRKENLILLVNLLKVPWNLLEGYIEENDVYKKVEKESLYLFIRCVKRMSRK